MKILKEVTISNWEETGMPEEMKNNLEKLAAERIKKLKDNGNFKAEEGAPFELLYSECDPFMEKDNLTDDAFALYFTVKDSTIHEGKQIIKLELNF